MPTARTFRGNQVSTVFAASGSILSLLGAPTSSGASTGLQNGSATRKHKCLLVVLNRLYRMRARTPGGRTLLGLFLEIAHSNPHQSRLIGEGGDRLASSRRATHSVPEGAIGIPLLFLCPEDLCMAVIPSAMCPQGIFVVYSVLAVITPP